MALTDHMINTVRNPIHEKRGRDMEFHFKRTTKEKGYVIQFQKDDQRKRICHSTLIGCLDKLFMSYIKNKMA